MAEHDDLRQRKLNIPKSTSNRTSKMTRDTETLPLTETDRGDTYTAVTHTNLYDGDLSGADNDLMETSLTATLLPSEDSEGEPVVVKVMELREPDEPSWQILLQVFVPYIIAGLGMVGAGMVLDIVQHWEVFEVVSEVFILVPALLGLKGNLEMTLASRLSTQANLGNMDSAAEQWKMIGGNIALTQAQAIVVGFLASLAAVVFGWIPKGVFNIHHALLLCTSSVLTASLASLVLGCIMIAVVILSRKCHINPDNVATPIAASLGDLTTLSLLSGIATFLYKAIDTHIWIAPTILASFVIMTPIWCIISHRNKYVHEVLYTGWTPVICAMVISSLGGLVLDFTVTNYKGIAVFQPVINGVGGNLVAVQASRLSTALHRVSRPGTLPDAAIHGCPNLFSTFFGNSLSSRTARVLLLLVVPGHALFITVIHFTAAGHTSITFTFLCFYMVAAILQVLLLLYMASWMVHYMWKIGDDPDNFAIPYLTALGDLLGTGFLAIAFHLFPYQTRMYYAKPMTYNQHYGERIMDQHHTVNVCTQLLLFNEENSDNVTFLII